MLVCKPSPHPLSTPTHATLPFVSALLSWALILRNDNHKQLIDQVDVWGGAAKLKPRILCGIYTYENNHNTKVKVSKAKTRLRSRSDQLEQIALGACLVSLVSCIIHSINLHLVAKV